MRNLPEQRRARGWSRAELARRAGLHPSTVGLIESGRLLPYPSQLKKLALALGVPLAALNADGGGVAAPPQGEEDEGSG